MENLGFPETPIVVFDAELASRWQKTMRLVEVDEGPLYHSAEKYEIRNKVDKCDEACGPSELSLG